MKRLIVFLFLLSATVADAQHATIKGRIYCAQDNAPLAGVAVSDGEQVVVSDAGGRYFLPTSLRDSLVFISVPSGYKAPVEGVVPRFFARVCAANATVDFALNRLPDDTRWRVIVCNDIHLENRPQKQDVAQFRSGLAADMQRLEPLARTETCIVVLGDMTTDKWWYKTKFGLPEYLREMERVGLAAFHGIGNHDHDIRGGETDHSRAAAYRHLFGPTDYSFNLAGTHWVVMDNFISYGPLDEQGEADYREIRESFTPEQLGWLERDLSLIDNSTPVVFCTHAPFYRYAGVETLKEGCGADVIRLLSRFDDVLLLTGHTHLNYNVQVSPRMLEHNNISISGSAWNTAQVCGVNFTRDGTPAGYMQCDIAGGSIAWHYIPCGGNWRTGQFRSYDLNRIPAEYGGEDGSNAVLINIFNWDPAWEVSVRENGRVLRVDQVWTTDPLYSMAAVGSPLMRAPSLRPARTNHMFRVQTSASDTPLEIEITDRFGNTFRERMSRPKEMDRVTTYR
ncbi:calcineurin-like phosphoesterase family protein [uncultured Alistipes sp.]|jgi:hypothetical protein bacD2_17610|uniref:calcineurin-like phosphoesterase family protein n=1 Tax=uncultured Alistipes sp. TaxID=538949 RepID=UPI0025F9FF30|nr:calcineurin-like phosphoesterase family protein [uncultured Alistipes sp.]